MLLEVLTLGIVVGDEARHAAEASDSSSELDRAKEQDQNPPVQNVVMPTTWTDVAKPEGNLVPTKFSVTHQPVILILIFYPYPKTSNELEFSRMVLY